MYSGNMISTIFIAIGIYGIYLIRMMIKYDSLSLVYNATELIMKSNVSTVWNYTQFIVFNFLLTMALTLHTVIM